MNKQELIAIVAEENEISKAQAGRVVDSVFDAIMKAVAKGEGFQLVGSVRSRLSNALLAKVVIRLRAKQSPSRHPSCRNSRPAPLSRLPLLRSAAASANNPSAPSEMKTASNEAVLLLSLKQRLLD